MKPQWRCNRVDPARSNAHRVPSQDITDASDLEDIEAGRYFAKNNPADTAGFSFELGDAAK